MSVREERKANTVYKYKTLNEINELLKSDPLFPRFYIIRANYYARKSKNPVIQKCEIQHQANYNFNTDLFPTIKDVLSRLQTFLTENDIEDGKLILADLSKALELARKFNEFCDSLDKTDFKKVMERKPKNTLEYLSRGVHLTRHFPQNLLEIIHEHSKIIDISPNNYLAIGNRALAYIRAPSIFNPNQAILNDLSKVLQIEPNFASAYFVRANVYVRRRMFLLAVQDYDTCVSLTKETKGNDNLLSIYYYKRARCKAEQKNLEGAKKDFEKSIECDPSNFEAFGNLARMYFIEQNFEKSLYFCSKAIELKSDYGFVLYGRGAVYLFMKEYESAIKDFTSNLECSKPFVRVLTILNRGRCFLAIGMFEKAILDFSEGGKSITINGMACRAWRKTAVRLLKQKIMKM